MMSGKLTAENDSSPWYRMRTNEGLKIKFSGEFRSGVLHIQQMINGAIKPLTQDGVAITFVDDNDVPVIANYNELFRIILIGYTTDPDPDIDYEFNANFKKIEDGETF